MKFRPCIDIHNGKVKQIVGGSLKDEKSRRGRTSYPGRMRHGTQGSIRETGLPGDM